MRYPPGAVSLIALLQIKFDDAAAGAYYLPVIAEPYQKIEFDEWWNQIVYQDFKGRRFTRTKVSRSGYL